MVGLSARSTWRWLSNMTVLLLAFSSPAFPFNRNAIQLQVRVRSMSDQAMSMQQSLDENFDAITQSLQQNTAQLAASAEKIAELSQSLDVMSNGSTRQPVTRQIKALIQSTTDLASGLETVEHQIHTLSAEIEQPAQPVVTAGLAPPADVLFRNGMEDYESGRYQLATQEFAQYVKVYSDSDQAAEAQFYLADSDYWAGNYQAAQSDFNKLEQQYPGTKEAAVELKVGVCQMKLGGVEAAKKELRYLVERYPDSVEAIDAGRH
jgi:TolA-binding protein